VENTRTHRSGPSEEEQQHSELAGVAVEEVQDLDLNHATAEQLASIDGIGKEVAEAIIRVRVHQGHFLRWEDLRKVSGLSEGQFHALQRATRIADPQAQG